jgi:pantothenate kinase
LRDLFDERWFIDVDLDVAMERVKARQVGNGAPLEVAEKRVATNDRPNAELILGTRSRADLIVPSLPFHS